MSEASDAIKTAAEKAIKNSQALEALLEALSDSSRRTRQVAASTLAEVANRKPELLTPYIPELIDALARPEARTRWEVLDALISLIPLDSRACSKALPEVESALYDEDSGPVRLGAMRFLCKLGATTENRSEKVWPLIDEAIQCYHGDIEFQDMLIAVSDFSLGKISAEVKQGLAARMEFDANNARGALKRRAEQIIANVS